MDSAIRNAREDLIDQGMRNTMINYRSRKSTGVEVIDERSGDVFHLLINNNKLQFLPDESKDQLGKLYISETSITPSYFNPKINSLGYYLLAGIEVLEVTKDELELYAVDSDASDERFTDLFLQTDYSSSELRKRLLKTYYDANTHIEEQGVNILFLALGMLSWYESEQSEIERKSPLVLIPVELTRGSINSNFVMKYTGDGIGSNLSLQAKLQSEFNLRIPLPELSDDQDESEFNINDYFDQVERQIQANTRWLVERDTIVLSFFSYAKYMMYTDLDPSAWPDNQLEEHSILSKLLGDGFGFQFSNQVTDYKREEIDEYLSVGNNFHIMDADSSQAQAILAAKEGSNLVIQGPPGTGKSQTIANIIAEFVGNGKSVLFVAEKMAALEVVKRRLDDVSVGDLCLPLHSHKANKRSVLDDLEHTLRLGNVTGMDVASELDELAQIRNNLSEYSDAVNTPVGNSKVTPFQAYGQYLRTAELLKDIDLPQWSNNEAARWSNGEYKERFQAVEDFSHVLKKVGKLTEHPFWGSRLTVVLPSTKDNILRDSRRALDALQEVLELGRRLSDAIQIDSPDNIAKAARLSVAAESIAKIPLSSNIDWASKEWIELKEPLISLIETGRKYSTLKEQYREQLISQAWDQDLISVRSEIKSHGDSVFRYFRPGYRRSLKALKGLFVGDMPKESSAQLAVIDDIMHAQELTSYIEKQDALGKRLFKSIWLGQASDWSLLSTVTNVLFNLHTDVDRHLLSEEIFQIIDAQRDVDSIEEVGKELKLQVKEYLSLLKSAFSSVQLDIFERYGTSDGERHQRLPDQQFMLEQWIKNIDYVTDIASLNQHRQTMSQLRLESLVELALEWNQAADYIVLLFERNWYDKLIETAFTQRQALAHFNRETHERILESFREKDQKLIEYNRLQLLKQHFDKLSDYSVATGQIKILKHEFEKKRRHKPIRRLITEAGQAIQAIKPVFMMSPMSVATYLPPGTVQFDLVVFDEASQIRPADALGSIVRANQAIVVGDSKQLPPTSFFDSVGDNEDEDAFTSHTESILGLFNAQSVTEQMLRWHYRSRHESLIATSNFEFYDNRLYIFPSPDTQVDELGLKFHHLPDTFYEAGRGKGNNRGEAVKVAQAVMKHAKNNPDLTLGVAAFSQSQMQVIRDELEILRRQNPETESYFSAHPAEPFFVKNLENVQGDERDVMFISIGYGKQADGRLSMNFGPLNRDGGERRLNVLITRAKMRCEIFTNLRHDDIDLDRTASVGVKALKRYLKYAETGDLELPQSMSDGADSPFEESVAEKLRQQGYVIKHQVGTAGFFIDLAVVDEKYPGRYLLGIECDGATYHSSASARERDRLRQAVLESKGWRIHRIWSTDWFNNMDRELQKVLESIEKAKTSSTIRSQSLSNQAERPIVTRIVREELRTPTESNILALRPYESAELQQFYYTDIQEVPRSRIESLVDVLVDIEGPIHRDEVIKQVSGALGFNRAGSNIKHEIEGAIYLMIQHNSLVDSQAFLMKPDKPIVARDRSDCDYMRKFDLVSHDEIQIVVDLVLKKSIGVKEDEIVQEVGRLLGFSRTTQKAAQRIQDVITSMMNDNLLRLENGYIFSSH